MRNDWKASRNTEKGEQGEEGESWGWARNGLEGKVAERRAKQEGLSFLPPWNCPQLLPVPGLGGFWQLTQPPGERDTHRQIHTETHSHVEWINRWRDRHREREVGEEAKDRKR